jgi:beta-lactamase regulating signal transducer with metallopeptidase domain
MFSLWINDLPSWLESLIAILVGTAAIVLLGWLAARLSHSIYWRKTIWQVTVLAVASLLVCEFIGGGFAVLAVGHSAWRQSFWQSNAPQLQDTETGDRDAEGGEVGPPTDPLAAPTEAQAKTTFRPEPYPVPNRTQQDDQQFEAWIDTGELGPVTDPAVAKAGPPTRLDGTSSRAIVPTANVDQTRPQRPIDGEAAAMATASAPTKPSPRWLLWVWLAGTGGLLARIGFLRIRLTRFCHHCTDISSDPLAREIDRLAHPIHFRRRVRLWQAKDLHVPVSWGVWRPKIVVPAAFTRQFRGEEQRVVLAHELAHLAAYDSAWQFITQLLCAVLWWHPCVWVVHRQLQTVSELVADDAARIVPNGPENLAACLVSLGRSLRSQDRLGWTGMAGTPIRSSLGRRVTRLLEMPRTDFRPPHRWQHRLAIISLPVVLVLFAGTTTASIRSSVPYSDGDTNMKLLARSWRQSLAATATLALFLPVAQGQDELPEAPPEAALESREDPELPRNDVPEAHREKGEPDAVEKRRAAERRAREEFARQREGREDAVLNRERDELREKIEELKHRLHSLRDDQDEEARELRTVLEELGVHLREVNRELEGSDGRVDQIARARAAKELVRLEDSRFQMQLQLLLEREDEGRQADLRRELEELVHHIRELRSRFGEVPQQLAERSRQQKLEHLEQLIRGLRTRDPELAEQLTRLKNEIIDDTDRDEVRTREPREREIPKEERDRRLYHLQMAIENLHAAGLHDRAEQLARESEGLIHKRASEGERRDGPHEVPDDRDEGLRDQVNELREQMHELREMIQDMRRERAR